MSDHAVESLTAFYDEHRLCGELAGGVDDGAGEHGRNVAWLECPVCGTRWMREV